jgi:hypothetical protein
VEIQASRLRRLVSSHRTSVHIHIYKPKKHSRSSSGRRTSNGEPTDEQRARYRGCVHRLPRKHHVSRGSRDSLAPSRARQSRQCPTTPPDQRALPSDASRSRMYREDDGSPRGAPGCGLSKVGRCDFPVLNDALVKARQILEGGGAIERIELLDGGSSGPTKSQNSFRSAAMRSTAGGGLHSDAAGFRSKRSRTGSAVRDRRRYRAARHNAYSRKQRFPAGKVCALRLDTRQPNPPSPCAAPAGRRTRGTG